MAPKMAFMPFLPPFMIIMSTCEHRYILQNRPDARKNTLQSGQKGRFWPYFGVFHGPVCEHRWKWPYPPRCSQHGNGCYTTIISPLDT